MKKKIAIVQARMSSIRLPEKVLKDLAGKPVLWHVFNQLSFSKKINEIILATSNDTSDDPLQIWAEKNNRKIFRGDLNNVLKRFYDTALKFEGDYIIRITADCPLIDPEIVDNTISKILNEEYDYCSNVNPPTFPDGLDTEVFTFEALKKAYFNSRLISETEHVTPYIRNHPEIFKIGNYSSEEKYDHYRWTLDNLEDYKFLSKIFHELYKDGSYIEYNKVLNYLKNNKNLLLINSQIKRNEGFEKSLNQDKEL